MRLAFRSLPRKVQKVFSVRKETGVSMRCFSSGGIKLRDLNRRAAIGIDTKERTADRRGKNNNAPRIPRAPPAEWCITNRLGITPNSWNLPEFPPGEEGDPLAVWRPKGQNGTIGIGQFLRDEGIEVAHPQAQFTFNRSGGKDQARTVRGQCVAEIKGGVFRWQEAGRQESRLRGRPAEGAVADEESRKRKDCSEASEKDFSQLSPGSTRDSSSGLRGAFSNPLEFTGQVATGLPAVVRIFREAAANRMIQRCRHCRLHRADRFRFFL